MLYNVVLVSGVQQSESTIYIHISFLPAPPSHCRTHLSRSSLSWAPCAVSRLPLAIYVTRGGVCMSVPLSVHPALSLLCLYSCPAGRFICAIFLDSIYICVNIRYLFFSFWLISLCITGSRFIYLSNTDSHSFRAMSFCLLTKVLRRKLASLLCALFLGLLFFLQPRPTLPWSYVSSTHKFHSHQLLVLVCAFGVRVWDYSTMKVTLWCFTAKMTVSTVISYIKEIVHWQVLLTALLLDFSALLSFLSLQVFLFSSVLGPPPLRKLWGSH